MDTLLLPAAGRLAISPKIGIIDALVTEIIMATTKLVLRLNNGQILIDEEGVILERNEKFVLFVDKGKLFALFPASHNSTDSGFLLLDTESRAEVEGGHLVGYHISGLKENADFTFQDCYWIKRNAFFGETDSCVSKVICKFVRNVSNYEFLYETTHPVGKEKEDAVRKLAKLKIPFYQFM